MSPLHDVKILSSRPGRSLVSSLRFLSRAHPSCIFSVASSSLSLYFVATSRTDLAWYRTFCVGQLPHYRTGPVSAHHAGQLAVGVMLRIDIPVRLDAKEVGEYRRIFPSEHFLDLFSCPDVKCPLCTSSAQDPPGSRRGTYRTSCRPSLGPNPHPQQCRSHLLDCAGRVDSTPVCPLRGQSSVSGLLFWFPARPAQDLAMRGQRGVQSQVKRIRAVLDHI